jgi:hypothetical protein
VLQVLVLRELVLQVRQEPQVLVLQVLVPEPLLLS